MGDHLSSHRPCSLQGSYPFSAASDLAICPIYYRWYRDSSWSKDWETLFHRPRRRYRDWRDHRDWQQRNAVSPGDFGRDRLVETRSWPLAKASPNYRG